MDLDKEIRLLREESVKNGELVPVNDKFIRMAEIYSAIDREQERISLLPLKRKIEANRPEEKSSALIDVQPMMDLEQEEFVNEAYLQILGRKVDEEGKKTWLSALAAVTSTYKEILLRLCDSEEGKKTGRDITGFKELDLADLTRYDDEIFVRRMYALLLGRTADPEGMSYHLAMLRKGDASKVDLIYAMCYSEEGKLKGVAVKGLDEEYRKMERWKKKRALYKKIPVVGKIVYCLDEIKRINIRLENEQRQKESFREYISELKTDLNNVRNELEQNDIRIDSLRLLDLKLTDAEYRISEMSKEKILLEKNLRNNNEILEKQYKEFSSRISSAEENLRNNNILLEKHEKEWNCYNSSDKIMMDKLTVEVSNLKGSSRQAREIIIDGIDTVKNLNAVSDHDDYNAIDYFDFENHFRGSREHIKDVEKIYIPYFEGKKNVLDLGCGRGEFTELLMEHGIGVTGVDQYSPYVEYMKMVGLPAVQEDALQYLNGQNEVDGIFLGQVAEHLKSEQIVALLELAYNKLEKGCFLIMETPNPKSLAIFSESFYKDPSHRNPIHPDTLKYLAEKAGFAEVDVLFTDSSRMPYKIPALKPNDEGYNEFNTAMNRVSELLYGSQDYAIIAKK